MNPGGCFSGWWNRACRAFEMKLKCAPLHVIGLIPVAGEGQ
jgi:hypothetical protein